MGKMKELLLDQEPNQTIVVNLFGGPSVGKSTLQAELYTSMKKAAIPFYHWVLTVKKAEKKS